MEQVEGVGPSGPLRLGVDASQQIRITLGIEHDHHITPVDVLANKQFRQARLADPGGPQHKHVPDPLTEIHPGIFLVRLHRMEGRHAPHRRLRF